LESGESVGDGLLLVFVFGKGDADVEDFAWCVEMILTLQEPLPVEGVCEDPEDCLVALAALAACGEG
jgi:hypothetical protein